MKRNTKDGLITYLSNNGILEKGNAVEILQAKKLYWNEYKRKWRLEKRRNEKEFTISLTNDELSMLSKEAKRHKRSITRFIKESSLAYINKVYLVPDVIELRQIHQAISMVYNLAENLYYDQKVDSKTGIQLLKGIQSLESTILPLLYHPKEFLSLAKEYININESNRKNLLFLINDSKEFNS